MTPMEEVDGPAGERPRNVSFPRRSKMGIVRSIQPNKP